MSYFKVGSKAEKPLGLRVPGGKAQNVSIQPALGSGVTVWTTSLSWARHICVRFRNITRAITTRRERTWPWIRMRPFLVRLSELVGQVMHHPERTSSPLRASLSFRYTQRCAPTFGIAGQRPSSLNAHAIRTHNI
jgi:hypothetical protein